MDEVQGLRVVTFLIVLCGTYLVGQKAPSGAWGIFAMAVAASAFLAIAGFHISIAMVLMAIIYGPSLVLGSALGALLATPRRERRRSLSKSTSPDAPPQSED